VAKPPLMSVGDLAKTSVELVERFFILEPKTAAHIVAERMVEEVQEEQPEFTAELARSLLVEHFAHLGRQFRLKQAKAKQIVIPGCEHLPRIITGKRGVRVHTVEATFSDAREYYWSLGRILDERKKEDPRRKEARALMQKMGKASKQNRGITVAEVYRLF
jgi:hypothetical protein